MMALTLYEEIELLTLLEEDAHYQSGQLIHTYFPETGELGRQAYPKHMAFFRAGATHQQRLFLAANRVGKTLVGCIELTFHLTGLYPEWWEGHRFLGPVRAWIVGTRSQTVRDILQATLLGPIDAQGTGTIPRETLARTSARMGIADAVEIVRVHHATGGLSTGVFKSYDQGRKAFEGTGQDVVLMDEEPPLEVYSECLLRLMTTHGLLMLTFTPLQGMSKTVKQFLPAGKLPDGPQTGQRYVVNASWDDAPHLTEAMKAKIYEEIPPFQRDARTKGYPQLGSGLIYPLAEADMVVEDFAIPKHWPRAYALDVGWNMTACLWKAWDPETGVGYLYSEYYRGEAEPTIHAEAIRARGLWIHGVIDPAAGGRSQDDGKKLITKYRGRGLILSTADNSVETGLYECWESLSIGKTKAFASLSHWREEVRGYQRDEKGRVRKEADHLMDCMRYLEMSGRAVAKAVPVPKEEIRQIPYFPESQAGWMG